MSRLHRRFQSTDINSKSKVKITYYKISLMELNTSYFTFCLMLIFIFGTIMSYGVEMTTKSSDNRYDIGVKGQGQIYR